MAGVKFVVIYPRPTDIEAFEKVYTEEHVPMAAAKLIGATAFTAAKVLASPEGIPTIPSSGIRNSPYSGTRPKASSRTRRRWMPAARRAR